MNSRSGKFSSKKSTEWNDVALLVKQRESWAEAVNTALEKAPATVNEDPDLAVEAIGLGASAFLLKSSASAELTLAIESALSGRTYITPLITKGKPLGVFLNQAARPSAEKLTARQREVLSLR